MLFRSQDLVPYFQRGCPCEEILRWMPAVTREELAVVKQYYHDHQAKLNEEDQRIREHVAEQIRIQRLRFPEESRETRLARMKQTLAQRQKERNGQGHPG